MGVWSRDPYSMRRISIICKIWKLVHDIIYITCPISITMLMLNKSKVAPTLLKRVITVSLLVDLCKCDSIKRFYNEQLLGHLQN